VQTALPPEQDGMSYEWCVGIDGGSQQRQVCGLDRDRRRVGARSVDPDGARRARLADGLWTMAAGPAQQGAGAIEGPRGARVEGLLDRGFPILAMHPQPRDRCRERPRGREPRMTGAMPWGWPLPSVPTSRVCSGSHAMPRPSAWDESSGAWQKRGAKPFVAVPIGAAIRFTGLLPSCASWARPLRRPGWGPCASWLPPRRAAAGGARAAGV
jgi:hypothetical protein